jgi:hypothetical protein
MSDIYLQITETPTVVTLSAPVISGALSSTVTVANTVTVALDANSLSALENVTVTVGAAITGTVTVSNFPTSQTVTFSAVTISNFPASQAVTFSAVSISNLPATQAVSLASVPTHGVTLTSTTVTVSSLPALAAGTAQIGSVTASISNFPASTVVCAYGLGTDGTWRGLEMATGSNRLKVDAANLSGGSSFPISGTVTLGAGTAQIGSVTASISGTVPVSGTFFQGTQPVSLTTLPALVAGTAQIGSVTVGNSVTISSLPAISGTVTANLFAYDAANDQARELQIADTGIGLIVAGSTNVNDNPVIISGTVTANTFAVQGTAVTTSNFTSTTASTVLANFNATREVLTIFNEGAGNLHICAGATCTTIAYQVRLSAGDYYEVPNHQSTITHSAVFATAGTARVCQVS